jgi:hypothetical protein
MQTVLDYQAWDTVSEGEITSVHDSVDVDVPMDVQRSIDTVLYYYKSQKLNPNIKLDGSPLEAITQLISQVRQTLPKQFEQETTVFLDFMIAQVVNYCRDNKLNSVSLNFSFDSGSLVKGF